jgi:hypothetical protein
MACGFMLGVRIVRHCHSINTESNFSTTWSMYSEIMELDVIIKNGRAICKTYRNGNTDEVTLFLGRPYAT